MNAVALFKCASSCSSQCGIQGTVSFHQCASSPGTRVSIDLSNFEPNREHAIHIHEYGDERQGCDSLGAHWNPTNHTHGSILVPLMESHAGDMINNLVADTEGEFRFEYYDLRISLRGSVDQSIIGRSVVIHYGTDDLGLGENEESLRTGNAGQRMACAIIGRAANS